MSTDAPDTTAQNIAAQQSAEVSKEQLALAREQYSDAKIRQAQFDPYYTQMIQDALKQSQTAQQRSDQQWDQYTSIFQPLENKMAETAANYDTGGRRDQAAADAVATVNRQMEQTRAAQQRGLQRAGVQLGSGRALTLDNASRLAEAKAAAGADYGARKQVEATGLSLVDNAAKFGRGLTSTGLSASQLGLAGNQTGQQAGATGQSVYSAALNPALNFYNASSANNASAASMYGNIANQQMAANASTNSTYAGLASTAVMAAMMMSSKKLKTGRKPVGRGLASGKPRSGDVEDAKVLRESTTPTADAVARVPVEKWRYKRGLGDSRQHVGPYAEDVQREFGDGVAPGGVAIHKGAMAAVNSKAERELDDEIASLERQIYELEAA